MADFNLIVGMDIEKSYKQFQTDITALVSKLNSNPIKVRVAMDDSSKKQISAQIRGLTQTAGVGGTVNVSGLKVLTKDSAELNNALRQVRTLSDSVGISLRKWTAAKNGTASGAYADLENYRVKLQELSTALKSGTMTQKSFQEKLSQIRLGVAGASGSIKAAGEATQGWAHRIGHLTKKFTSWFGVSQIIMGIYRSIRKMITSVTELDTAMTELKKVTDESDATYERFLTNATNRAKKLGATLTDTVNASADFARLGYSIDQAEKLADAALVYKNVGDGIESIDDASESVIATMQAFGDEVNPEEVMSIVDKFNKVGNNYAISSKGVGEALLRSAAAMHAANNSLDETIALAAASNTIVQNPEKVGKCYAQQYSNVLQADSYIG